MILGPTRTTITLSDRDGVLSKADLNAMLEDWLLDFTGVSLVAIVVEAVVPMDPEVPA